MRGAIYMFTNSPEFWGVFFFFWMTQVICLAVAS